jgi:hypothetical protein
MGPKLKYLQIYIVYGGTIELSITPGKDFFCRAGAGLFEYYSSLGITPPLISDFAKYRVIYGLRLQYKVVAVTRLHMENKAIECHLF